LGERVDMVAAVVPQTLPTSGVSRKDHQIDFGFDSLRDTVFYVVTGLYSEANLSQRRRYVRRFFYGSYLA